MKNFTKISLLGLILLSSCAVSAPVPLGTFTCVPTENTYSLNFNPSLSSGLPCNVDTKAVNSAKNIAQEQRYFDIFSWQSFIALNWPTVNGGKTLSFNITDTGSPRWNYWKESYEVFRNGGVTPEAWGTKSKPENICTNHKNTKGKKIVYRTNKLTPGSTVADEIDQAFTYPLVDQNGNLVRYEVLMNYDEFEYINNNELYNIDGQIKFTGLGENVNFPKGDNSTSKTGAIELKMAWKVMTDNDPAGRYYIEDALIANSDGTCEDAQVGLIGVHLSHKTAENKQWVWATFEHVDNVRTNQLTKVQTKDGNISLKPSFNNPECPTCPVNVFETDENGNPTPVQVTRVIPIEKNTQELNRQVQSILAKNKSVFQYYELVGTQWPIDENAAPASTSALSSKENTYEQIANKPGGKPHPVYLINSIMETFMQYGNQKAQLQIQGFPFNETQVFATESCMGCHYSSGVAATSYVDNNGDKQAVYAPAGSGDFSWLLQLKAQWKKDAKPIK